MSARIEDWSIITSAGFLSAPQTKEVSAYIEGVVYDDPKGRFPDGVRIYTSKLKHVNFNTGKVRTANSEYLLGSMNFDFAMLLDHSNYGLFDIEARINRVRLVSLEIDKPVNWKVHRILTLDGSFPVAIASYGDGTSKIIVRQNKYGVVHKGAVVSEIDDKAMEILKKLPDTPVMYQPYIDFIKTE